MLAARRLRARVRNRIGRAAHAAGAATRADIQHLLFEQERLASQIADLMGALQRVSAVADSLEARQQQLDGRIAVLERPDLDGRTAALERAAAIQFLGRFIEQAQLKRHPLVSVVLPTRGRPEFLQRAIASVMAQRYEAWELLVVDDGEIATSRGIIDALAETRIRWAQSGGRGACAARNVGLAIARGELIAYLDDDNVMDPGWLHSVVWAFEHRPEVDVLYGAWVVDDPLRAAREASGELPRMYMWPWDRELLRQINLADTSAIAHRSGLPEARFDESLVTLGDWDLLVRLTATRDPLVLPAVACYYMTDAPNRLTGGPTQSADTEVVTGRAAMSGR